MHLPQFATDFAKTAFSFDFAGISLSPHTAPQPAAAAGPAGPTSTPQAPNLDAPTSSGAPTSTFPASPAASVSELSQPPGNGPGGHTPRRETN